jgi:hypothetical protein
MTTPSHADAPTLAHERPIYLGVFLVSMSVLLLQIALTRIFSFTIWYHFAYVTISVALLGYGASGAFLAVFPALSGGSPGRRLSLYALACGLAIVVAFVVIAKIPFHPFQVRAYPSRQVPWMILYYLAVTAPFFFAGLCVSVALKTLSHQVSRLYFADLLGAGLGCGIVVYAIKALTTPGAVIAAAVLVSLAGAMFAATGERRRLLLPAAGTALVGVLGLCALAFAHFKPAPEKFLYNFMDSGARIQMLAHHWSPIFRTDVFRFRNEEESRTGSYAGWGISPAWEPLAATRGPKLRMISHDGDAAAVIYHFDGDLSKLEMFEHHVIKTPYLLLERPKVLVIGVGGGTDIVNAIRNRASHVTGVELDPYTVDVVKYHQADFAGRIYERPDVTMITGEGRSTVRHSTEKYDLIQLTGVDTLAALSTGAYVLSESYLYTTQAMHEFLDHLRPGGFLSIMVADFAGGDAGYPRHTLRQLSLFMKALEERGIHDPQNRVAVVTCCKGTPQVELLLKNGRFTPEESRRVQDFSERMGFTVWARPGVKLDKMHSLYLHMPPSERKAFLDTAPLILTPTTDDNPFFFNFYRWRNLGKSLGEVDVGHTLATGQIILGLILLFSIVFSVVLILLPLFAFQRRGLQTRGKWGFVAFFAAIGLGFILIEISFIQKFVLFLGYPTYSLTVVLFSLLTYSGIGSYLTGRMQRPPEDRLLLVYAGLAAIALLYLVGLPPLFRAFLGSPLPLRVIIASAVLVPLGLLMGMFFPSGIQIVRRANVSFVPWAWGINGCASVVGTVLAVILAMGYGFRFVTFVALAIYLVGVLGIRTSARGIAA